ncbi:hypothetical protein M9H77_21513 [Catharanthus roseus]|uniref:Uncharacterized protein n=1 Tax=Catharanthus roseus TaxID=4058 RepID=A0ACC0AP97_CATRO|nr:hypothetical protein M9H77_21513 [Catharanthus roseus]
MKVIGSCGGDRKLRGVVNGTSVERGRKKGKVRSCVVVYAWKLGRWGRKQEKKLLLVGIVGVAAAEIVAVDYKERNLVMMKKYGHMMRDVFLRNVLMHKPTQKCSQVLKNLSRGPSKQVKTCMGYIVNGFQFQARNRGKEGETYNDDYIHLREPPPISQLSYRSSSPTLTTISLRSCRMFATCGGKSFRKYAYGTDFIHDQDEACMGVKQADLTESLSKSRHLEELHKHQNGDKKG